MPLLSVTSAPITLNVSNSVAVGLEAYWKLDENTGQPRMDSVGVENLAQNGGTVYAGTGIINQGVVGSFGAGVPGLVHADDAVLGQGAGVSFTFTAWAKLVTVPSVDNVIFSKWEDDGGSPGMNGPEYNLSYQPGGIGTSVIHWRVGDLSAVEYNIPSTVTLPNPDNEWYFVACGYDAPSGNAWISVNLEPPQTATISGVLRRQTPFLIGANSNTHSGLTNNFQGNAIDEIGLWKRTLSFAEIAYIYNFRQGRPLGDLYLPAGDVGSAYAQNWAARVVLNGGPSPSASTELAITAFIDGLNTDGLLQYMQTVNIMAPDSLVASLTPVIFSSTSQWTNHNFVAGDLSVNGLQSDGSTKYLDTNAVIGGLVGQNNYGLTVYCASAPSGGGTQFDLGAINAGNSAVNGALVTNLGGTTYFEAFGYPSGTASGAAPAVGGYYSGNRISATDCRLFFANSGNAHAQLGLTCTTQSAGYVAYGEIYAFAAYDVNSSGPYYYANRKISFVAIHQGLTAAQSAKFYSRIQTLRQALGGGYV